MFALFGLSLFIGTIEAFAPHPAEEQDMPTRMRSSHRRKDDGLSPEEASLADYSLTDEESANALEIPPGRAGTMNPEEPSMWGSSAVAPTRTGLRSQTVGRQITSSSKGGPSSRASTVSEASPSGAGSSTRARTSRIGSRTTRPGSFTRSSDPKSSKSLKTPQGVAEGRVAKAVPIYKDAVMR